jgi:hypothetical protein
MAKRIEPAAAPATLTGITDYERLELQLIDLLRHGPCSFLLDLPTMADLDRGPEEVFLAVQNVAGLTRAEWEKMSRAAREPYLQKAIAVQENQADESTWLTQAAAARWLETYRTKVARLIQQGKLKTNGKPGRACRVNPASIWAYTNREDTDL